MDPKHSATKGLNCILFSGFGTQRVSAKANMINFDYHVILLRDLLDV